MAKMIPSYLKIAFRPTASAQAVVSGPNVRFTVISSRMLRMEYSPSNEFEDHASQTFWFREQPVPGFTVERSPERIEIHTDALHLTYQINPAGFGRHQLSVQVLATSSTWRSGTMNNRANLRGTTRTLDGVDGRIRLDPGLMSREGWAVADDSSSLVFDEEGWINHRAHPENKDIYFFGYGHDYLGCLREFSAVSGEVPLIPRWALGNWWSRYWEYSQQDYLELMAEFKERGIPPLSVSSIWIGMSRKPAMIVRGGLVIPGIATYFRTRQVFWRRSRPKD
jgi:alpha-glucosidase (family GH31 glycosyl hydrolase)